MRIAILMAGLALAAPSLAAADEAQVERGRYLVGLAGCNDCHTPGYFLGNPDMTRFLGGSDVGFEIPGLGVFLGRNLTPDKETGLGTWSQADIVRALTTGERPDGRILAPIMPYHAFAGLTPEDQVAIAAFLQSLPPVSHAVPGPFAPGETVPAFFMRTMPPGQVAAPAP
jgi:mono/diheme cytochrome c family protein